MMPTSAPSSTTGRRRNLPASILRRAAASVSSALIVIGFLVIQRATIIASLPGFAPPDTILPRTIGKQDDCHRLRPLRARTSGLAGAIRTHAATAAVAPLGAKTIEPWPRRFRLLKSERPL